MVIIRYSPLLAVQGSVIYGENHDIAVYVHESPEEVDTVMEE
jgi:hypothetical protein